MGVGPRRQVTAMNLGDLDRQRAQIVAFVRRYTHLRQLADMLEARLDVQSDAAVREWAKSRKVSLR